jgi:hypothetical protein
MLDSLSVTNPSQNLFMTRRSMSVKMYDLIVHHAFHL